MCHIKKLQGASATLPAPIKIVGMGSAGVDYLAQVAAYPQPDEKLRTERLETQGGGNCGNALTAAARLGLAPYIVTKIGGDGLGDGIIKEFHGDGVATDCVLRAEGAPSPFTYIIVDRQGATRTCIHTPGEAFRPEEVTSELIEMALSNAAVVYFDGRLTEAALLLARAARQRSIPILVEAERLRPGLEELLQEADYVVTSAHFPGNWTGEESVGNAIAVTFARLPNVKWMITTLGKKGSVLLERKNTEDDENPVESVIAEDLIQRLFFQAEEGCEGVSQGDELACTSANGIEIFTGAIVSASSFYRLCSQGESNLRLAKSEAAAIAAAAANADSGNVAKYQSGGGAGSDDFTPPEALVTVSQAARLPPEAVLDTTGAGDAFIGTVLYCIATGLSPKHALRLGGVVAACKCTALGARPGLPKRTDLAANLL